MSFPKSFYKGIIFCSAKKSREKDGIYKTGSEEWRYAIKPASDYIKSTEKMMELFSYDTDKLWNFTSIQKKMGIDVRDVELILDVLVEYKFIETIETDDIDLLISVKHYRYAKDRTPGSWAPTVFLASVATTIVGFLIYENYFDKEWKPVTEALLSAIMSPYNPYGPQTYPFIAYRLHFEHPYTQ